MRLSVIIPSYNAGNYLMQAISSVKGQKTNFPLTTEIIVIDDGSTDNSIEQIKDTDITILYQDHKGAAAARNHGWKSATGEYILFLDADDILVESAIQNFFEALTKEKDRAVCLGLAEEFISEEIAVDTAATLFKKPNPFKGFFSGCCFGENVALSAIGMFDTELASGEVVEWMARLQHSGLNIVQLNKVTVRRRIHLTNTGRIRHQEELESYAKILRRRLQAHRMGNK